MNLVVGFPNLVFCVGGVDFIITVNNPFYFKASKIIVFLV